MERLKLFDPTGCATIEEILTRPEYELAPGGQDLVRRAYEFALKAHEGQTRKSGEPYFSHPSRVALLLADLVNDPATVAAGLLHDTIEDCGVTEKQIANLFGEPVAELVEGVTKISALKFSSDREKQVETLRKMILAMARDIRVVLIKLCDRLHNMLTLSHLPPHKQRTIAQQTLDIYAPLANRIGMTRMRAQLEDLCMIYLYPAIYKELNAKMAVRRENDQEIVDATRGLLMFALEQKGIQGEIQGRRKHIYSLYNKMKDSGLSFEEVHDILGLRVITENIADCYEVLGIVHSEWKPIPGRFKDYIATPKSNGYSSIHTSVLGPGSEIIEIQIRTRDMHNEAEQGIAAHWKYKEKDQIGSSARWGVEEKRLAWVRQLVDWLKDVRDPSEFMRELKRDVYSSAVFVYTPKGDIIEVEQGYTVLDLAYRIHSQIGHHCAAAKVNNRIASIRTEMKTGDIVEIITNKTAHPTPDWLKIVQSGKARNKIRHWLKINQREKYLGLGRKMLVDKAHIRFGSNADEAKIRSILTDALGDFSVDSYDDLLVELGSGTIKTPALIARLDKVLRPGLEEPKREPRHVRLAKASGAKKTPVLVDGVAGVVTRMAKCCSPMPGDPIVGYVTVNRGIAIHHENCKALEHQRERQHDFESRLVRTHWDDGRQPTRKTSLRVVSQDRKGLMSDLTSAITQMDINIVGVNSSSNLRENRAIIKLTMLIQGTEQLTRVQQRLSTVPGVLNVSRVTAGRSRPAARPAQDENAEAPDKKEKNTPRKKDRREKPRDPATPRENKRRRTPSKK